MFSGAANVLKTRARPLAPSIRFGRTWRGLLGLGILAAAAGSLPAADVQWIADADGYWHVADNWSSQPLLPSASDNVMISRPGFDVTVTHSQGATTIVGLLCDENLAMGGGGLTVTGSAQIDGSLTTASGASLKAQGPGATFTASGATALNGGSLYASTGGKQTLPLATSYVNPSTAAWSDAWLKADGAGSMLDLSALTTLAGSTGSFSCLYIQALSAGQVDLGGISTYSAAAGCQVLADGEGGEVDLSAMTSFTPGPIFGETNSITARNGGAVLMGNLTTLDGVNLNIDGTGTMATGQITTYTGGKAAVTGGHLDFSHVTNLSLATIDVRSGATTDVSNAAAIDGASFIAGLGVTLSAPFATSYVNPSTAGWSDARLKADGAGSLVHLSGLTTLAASTGPFSQLFIQGINGGHVDVSHVTVFDTGSAVVLADGPGSLVDLSSLGVFAPSNTFGRTSSIEARNSGMVRLHPDTTTVTGASVVLGPDGTIRVGTLALGTNAGFAGEGTLPGNVFNQRGVVRPGYGSPDPGVLTIGGTYTQDGAVSLAIEIGGQAAGSQHDVLSVSGTASLGGTLAISLISGFAPSLGETFEVINSASCSGTFALLTGSLVNEELALAPMYGSANLVLRASIPGDVDLDDDVEDGDLSMLLTCWGQSGKGWPEGDFTGDRTVSDGDLSLMLTNWTETLADGTAPEPGALCWLALGALSLLRRAERRRARPA